MPRPWTLIDEVQTDDGLLELRMRGEREAMISVDKRVLMTSTFNRSERALAELGCASAAERPAPRVLVVGLGLGYTLRAALDLLPAEAQVVVAELNPVVVDWCRGPAAAVSGSALADPRVEVVVDDGMAVVRRAADDPEGGRFDAILLDLYEGPGPIPPGQTDPLYGPDITGRAWHALSPGGTYAVWGEDREPSFERRLRKTGFDARTQHVRGGGPTHVIYVATRPR